MGCTRFHLVAGPSEYTQLSLYIAETVLIILQERVYSGACQILELYKGVGYKSSFLAINRCIIIIGIM